LTILFAGLYCDKVVTKEGLLLDGEIAVNFGKAVWEAFILELKKRRKSLIMYAGRGTFQKRADFQLQPGFQEGKL